MTYSEKLKDPRWQKKRLEILKRDNFTCAACKATKKTLHVHHSYYSKDPWSTKNSVLLTLCEDCHQERGKLEEDIKFMLGKIMSKLPTECLKAFIKTIDRVGKNMGEVSGSPPALINIDELFWAAEGRWRDYATLHSEARKFYEDVTKHQVNWKDWEDEQPTESVQLGTSYIL